MSLLLLASVVLAASLIQWWVSC